MPREKERGVPSHQPRFTADRCAASVRTLSGDATPRAYILGFPDHMKTYIFPDGKSMLRYDAQISRSREKIPINSNLGAARQELRIAVQQLTTQNSRGCLEDVQRTSVCPLNILRTSLECIPDQVCY